MKEKPKLSKSDIAHKIVKAGLSAIPLAGGPAAELFNAIISPPLAKRRDKWIESIAEGLKELEEKIDGFKIESLQDNEMFITTVMHASQAAIRNHQKEKLEALRNAVLNSTSPNAPQEDLQLMFLNWVDELTTWHLRILKFLEDPKGWAQKYGITLPDRMMGAPAHALEDAFQDLRGQRDFYDQIIKELYSKGLTHIESLHVTMTGQGMYASRTTDMGKQFLQFITSPIEDEERSD
jgi:hypothetical protein